MTKPNRTQTHGLPGKLEGFHPLALKAAAVPALINRLKTVKPTPSVSILKGYDDVTASAEPSDGQFYGFYFNGTYANGTDVKSRFPGRHYISITPNGMNGARCGDVEPGDMVNSQAPGFIRNPNHDGGKPILYTSAGNMADLERTIRSAGIPRSDWFLWSAHYTNVQHFCGPRTCGYGLSQADLTQYSTGSYDSDIAESYVFGQVVVPPPNPYPSLIEGATGAAVITLQRRLNTWGARPQLTTDGTFGQKTKDAVLSFQRTHSLVPDGVVGVHTWEELNKSPVPPPLQKNWKFPAPSSFTARGGHTTVFFEWNAVAPIQGKRPDGYQIVIYGDPPQLDAAKHWMVVKKLQVTTGLDIEMHGLELGKSYQAHIWALGSPVSSEGNYATVHFKTA